MKRTVEITSPFPISELPSLYRWIQPFKKAVLHDASPKDIHEFVEQRRARESEIRTWAAIRSGEFGGYIEFDPIGEDAGYCEALFKPEFWGSSTTIPVLDQVMESLFSDGIQMVFFRPFERNRAIRAMAKRLGAREIGTVNYGETKEGKAFARVLFGLVQEAWEESVKWRTDEFQRVA